MINSYTTHKKRGEIAGFGTLLNTTKGNPYHDKLGRFASKGAGSKSSGKDVADKNYRAEQEAVDVRDGHIIGTDYANLVAQLDTARTNLKTLERDSKRATGSDISQKSRYLTRQAEIARAISQAKSLKKIKPSKETIRLVSEIQSELKEILSDYENLGTKLFEKQKSLNAGTSASGWWNPDHAARVALRSPNARWIDNLNGDGQKYAKTILENVAIDSAVARYATDNLDLGKHSPQIDTSGDSILRSIKEIAGQDLKNGTLQTADRKILKPEEVDEIISYLKGVDYLTEAFSNYATGLPDGYKSFTLNGINNAMNNLKNRFKVNEPLFGRTEYVDKSNKPVSLSKIYGDILKDLNDYYTEIRYLFR